MPSNEKNLNEVIDRDNDYQWIFNFQYFESVVSV